jgi:hypothetical protein
LNLIFSLIILSSLIIFPAFGQESNPTGLKQNFEIETGGYDFTVDIISSFNVEEIEFSSDDKRLTFYFYSGIKNNLAEIQIPINLINGNFTFFLNDQEIFPLILTNEQISFITLEFEGDGNHKLDIIGTTYLPEFAQLAPMILTISLIGIILAVKLKKIEIIR